MVEQEFSQVVHKLRHVRTRCKEFVQVCRRPEPNRINSSLIQLGLHIRIDLSTLSEVCPAFLSLTACDLIKRIRHRRCHRPICKLPAADAGYRTAGDGGHGHFGKAVRSEEHTSEL